MLEATNGMSAQMIFGIIAGIVSFAAHPLYIAAILRGETKPHPFTWTLSSLSAGISIFFFLEAGGAHTAYVLWGDFVGLTLIAALSFWHRGSNGKIRPMDWAFLVSSLASITIFVLFHNALWAFAASLADDVFALGPTIRKTYRHPNEEDLIAWLFTVLGNALNFFALEWGNTAETLYVFVIFFVDGVVFWLIIQGRGLWRSTSTSITVRSLL